jgi:predicted HAD superfamily phosphohydrolase YqeG
MVFLDIDNNRYTWAGNSITRTSIAGLDNDLIRVGLANHNFKIVLEYKALKAVFFDLGNTLVKPVSDNTGIIDDVIVFPEVNEIITSLKNRGIKLGIISNGSRNLLKKCLQDQNSALNRLFDKFNLIIMSDDDVGGVQKPNKKIFEKAISQLDPKLNLLSTTFIAEETDINHFKVYNFLFIQQLKEISSYI